MRLIDADAVKAMIYEKVPLSVFMRRTISGAEQSMGALRGMIDELPTIEADPVVRCKDCKFYPDGEGTTKWEPCCDMITPPNWYCADGQRKDGGDA